ncbi:MFS transporter [Streptomyces sp. FxanaA7]|uniref:MFS transporter n=1 Tax=Streptomyces sp. FxanaA7 TaxID=1265492 RepID=UPI0005EEE1FA|nr:MFS transporter [Streptomyces sp. FxanaA7]
MSVATYREFLRTPSVSWLFLTSIVGRFNQGMTSLALLMLTIDRSSYAVYSAVSAVGMIGALVSGPLVSRLAEGRGRRRVLAATAVLHTVAMGTLILVPPEPVLLIGLSLCLGLCTPPLTSTVRATVPMLVRPEQGRTFFALEATAQEVVFVVGPVITSTLAAFGGPHLALAACGTLVLVGTLAYAAGRDAEAGRVAVAPVRGGAVLRVRGLSRLFTAGALLTCALAAQVLGVVALVSGSEVSTDAGFVLAVGSLGSLVGGLVHGARRRQKARLRRPLLYVAAGLGLLALTPGQTAVTVLLFFWGMTVAPALSSLFERLSATAPTGSAAEAFGWMGSVLAIGNVAGTTLAGLLVTGWGARAPLAVACVLALLAALVCEPWRRSGRRGAAASDGTTDQVTDRPARPPVPPDDPATFAPSTRQDQP